jgi:hypothetical protein
VFLNRTKRMFPIRAGRFDFGDACASRCAVSMLCIKSSERDVVGRVHNDRNDVFLPHPHEYLEMVALLRENFRLKHLRREMLRIGSEVPQQVLKVGSFGSRYKRCAAPVVQQCSGKICTRRRGELLDDQLSSTQPLLSQRSGSRKGEKGIF